LGPLDRMEPGIAESDSKDAGDRNYAKFGRNYASLGVPGIGLFRTSKIAV
jgi:hypothetical protein